VFSVDYLTLRQIIIQFSYTGVFRAEIPSSSRSIRERGQIELLVKDGKVLACRFIPVEGQIQMWTDWETRLTSLGMLDWDLQQGNASFEVMQESRPLPTRSRQSSEETFTQPQRVIIPYRTISVEAAQLHQWPMSYRTIYLLIDGKRTASDIANLLSKPLEDIVPFLDELSKRGIIKTRQ
jgi:hypothetical protein